MNKKELAKLYSTVSQGKAAASSYRGAACPARINM